MPRKREHDRALGPYKHGTQWRVVYINAAGVRQMEAYATYEKACEERDAANLAAGGRTLSDAVDAYLEEHKADRGIETLRYRLRAIFRLKEGDRLLAVLTAPVAASLYAQRTTDVQPSGKPVAADTHHGELRYAKQFCDWCVKRGWLRANPFASVEPVGKKRKGKPKLRVNATRAFLAKLLSDDSVEATAVMTALMLGLRANEVVKRVVDDLDDDGRLLWIRDSKTENSDREIEVPEVLRVRLLELATGKQPTDRLFGNVTRHWLLYHTVRLCEEAGVPRVTPHGLRGSGATTAVRMGGSVEDVARALGHGDEGSTLKAHYLGGGAIESARARRIEDLMLGTKRDRIVPNDGSEVN